MRNSELTPGHITDFDSSAVNFQSDATLLPDSPTRQQLQERVNSAEGTLASLHYQSFRSFRTQSSLILTPTSRRKARQGNGSSSSFMSFGSSSFLFKQSNRTKKPSRYRRLYNSESATLGRKANSKNEEKLRQIEQRIRNNTNHRKFQEDTSLICYGEKLHRLIYQPRSEKHDRRYYEEWNSASLVISRGEVFDSKSEKKCQDCLATSSWKDYECIVVCDGHGKCGEEMAWQVCNYISGHLIENIIKYHDGQEDLGSLVDTEVFEKCTSEKMIKQVFEACDNEVIWSRELKNWSWAKITGGKFAGLLAQITSPDVSIGEVVPSVSDVTEEIGEEEIPATVFLNGERRWKSTKISFCFNSNSVKGIDRQVELPVEQHLIKRKHLFCERDYYGGCTCLAFIRNRKTKQFKFATSGDSRLLLLPPKGSDVSSFTADENLIPLKGAPKRMTKDHFRSLIPGALSSSKKRRAFVSIEHNIHDPRELERLNRDFPGCFVIGNRSQNGGVEGYMYSNAMFPYTGGITPTRGFGDRIYYGTGYTSRPEVSKTHFLRDGTIIIGGSDGVFDDAIWGTNMDNLVFFITALQNSGEKISGILAAVQTETVQRCKKWDHFRVDDISLFGVLAADEEVDGEASKVSTKLSENPFG